MTPKQQRVIDFICDAVKEKGFACEVTLTPRTSGEGAQIKTSSERSWDKIGVTADGYPLVVSMSPTHDPKYNTVVKRALSKAKKL